MNQYPFKVNHGMVWFVRGNKIQTDMHPQTENSDKE
jgi:hypothetical protein